MRLSPTFIQDLVITRKAENLVFGTPCTDEFITRSDHASVQEAEGRGDSCVSAKTLDTTLQGPDSRGPRNLRCVQLACIVS